jgi:predicted enzyme related to lactoylglutathione lyase
LVAKIDHIGIVVKDLKRAMNFYSEVFGWKQPDTGPYSKMLEIERPGDKSKYVLLQGGGPYIELFEPKEGPWLKRLNERGEGSIWQICVSVDNIEKFYDVMNERGITPVDSLNKPLTGRKYIVTSSGSKIFYLPPAKTYGTWFEILERPR